MLAGLLMCGNIGQKRLRLCACWTRDVLKDRCIQGGCSSRTSLEHFEAGDAMCLSAMDSLDRWPMNVQCGLKALRGTPEEG